MSDESPPKPGAEFQVCDLFGDPVPANWCKRGRPPHVKTEESRQKVLVGLALGWTVERIARGLRIAKGTLAKHYSAELRQAELARDALVLAHKHAVIRRALKGNDAGALKQLGQMIDRHGLDFDPIAAPPKANAPTVPAPWRKGSDLGDGGVAGTA